MGTRGELEMLGAVLERAAELRNTLTTLTNEQAMGRQWPDLLDQYTILTAKLHNFNTSLHPALSDTTALPVLKEDIDRVPLLLRTKVLPELEDAERTLLPPWESDAAAEASLDNLKQALAAADAVVRASEAELKKLSASALLPRSRAGEGAVSAPGGQAVLFGALLRGDGMRPEGVTSDQLLKDAVARAQAVSSARAAAAAATLAGTKRPAPAPLPGPVARPKASPAKPPAVATPPASAAPALPAPAPGVLAAPIGAGVAAPVSSAALAKQAARPGIAAAGTGLAGNVPGALGVNRLASAPMLASPPAPGAAPAGAVAARMPSAPSATAGVGAVAKAMARPAYAAPPPMHAAYAAPPKPAAVSVPMTAAASGMAGVPQAAAGGAVQAAPQVRAGPPPGTLAPNMLHAPPPGGFK